MITKRETEGAASWPDRLAQAKRGVEELRRAAFAAEGEFVRKFEWVAPAMHESALNLVHYLAHIPVIWATQVLESLAKGGLPSRAEVSDAAMASRAECVMLNKGPYILETLRFLIDVSTRIEEHHHKKSSWLRRLRVAGHSFQPPPQS